MNILYKKCGRGHINKYMENEEGPELCEVCGLPFPFGTDELRYDESVEQNDNNKQESECLVEPEKTNAVSPIKRTRFSLVIQKGDIYIDIPDDANKAVLGRQGLGSEDRLWGENVSRKHLAITSKLGGIFVEDLGSTNGTMVNGEVLEANKPKFITEGSIIVLDAIKQNVVLTLERNI